MVGPFFVLRFSSEGMSTMLRDGNGLEDFDNYLLIKF